MPLFKALGEEHYYYNYEIGSEESQAIGKGDRHLPYPPSTKTCMATFVPPGSTSEPTSMCPRPSLRSRTCTPVLQMRNPGYYLVYLFLIKVTK